MNLIACADLHIRSNRPQYRKDDYWKTTCRKFKQIISLCNKHNANLIVAGDFFDSTRVGHKVVNQIIKYIKKLKGKIYVVAGQHDQVYRKEDLQDSPLYTLVLSGKVLLLDKDNYVKHGEDCIYGCSYGQEPIKPETPSNILVIHKTITPKEPPFFLKDAISAEQALDKYERYFLIISGDYHQPFTVEKWGNVLINCGPMMRSSIDQTELEPKVWLIADNKIRTLELKIEPAENVFALENIKNVEQSRFSKDLAELVESLKDKSSRPDYKETVNLLVEEGKISSKVKDRINLIMGSVIDEQ